MKTILYTGHDEVYKPLADLTVPRMKAYADRHGFDFMAFTEPLIAVPEGIFWTGVCGALKLLNEGYDRTVYLDVDQMVTNYDYDVSSAFVNLRHGIHVPKDWGEDAEAITDCSACCIVCHQDCTRILESVVALEPEFRGKPFPEQAPLRKVLKDLSEEPLWPVYYWGRKPWNCVPDEVCPGKVPEPWQPNDWCAHLTMLPLNERITLYEKIAHRVG